MEQRAAVKAGEGYMQKTVLWTEAKLLSRTRLNVQKGQEVIIVIGEELKEQAIKKYFLKQDNL